MPSSHSSKSACDFMVRSGNTSSSPSSASRGWKSSAGAWMSRARNHATAKSLMAVSDRASLSGIKSLLLSSGRSGPVGAGDGSDPLHLVGDDQVDKEGAIVG